MSGELANATLAGHVNDWVVCAKENASNVLRLLLLLEAERSDHLAKQREFDAELHAARQRLDEERSRAARAHADRDVALAEVRDLNERLVHARGISRDLAQRIHRVKGNELRFQHGSQGVVERFQREFVDA